MSENNSGLTDRATLASCKRVVVKVGSSLLTSHAAGIEHEKINSYCAQISALVASGMEVILVSSGAVAEGCKRLGWSQRPTLIHQLQAAAAVGQMGLVQAYEDALSKFSCGTAFVMLTHDDLADRQRYLNARGTLNTLVSMGVVPVINENDTVATDEIRFGDNDTLAALVANLLEADLLIILTDVEGLLDADPRGNANAKRVVTAVATDPGLDAMPGEGAGALGRGGMVTKVRAGRLAARSGADTLIASGHESDVLTRLIKGEDIGTLLTAEISPLNARKRWIAGHLRAKGTLRVDAGAVSALRDRGVSLLAAGIIQVQGDFLRGDVVRCISEQGALVAQGLSNYSSSEIEKIKGLNSEVFAQVIEHVVEPEVVHRDNLVLLEET
ncbi:glutamate 5-kinase [Pseudomonadales bacterium]|nr:glutamate 5-kinase [Pseudomonadales bacterium]